MRVLFYRRNLGFNGVTAWMQDLGEGLKRRGVDVSFWFVSGPRDRAVPFEALGPTNFGSIPELMRALEREQYDVVHVHTGDRHALAVTLPHIRSRVIATNHGSITYDWNSTNCHALTSVSADVAAIMQPFTDLTVELIYNAVSVDRFSCPTEVAAGRPIIAWVGRALDFRTKDFARFTRIASHLAPRGFRIWVADGSGASASDFQGEGYAPVDYDNWTRLTLEEMPEFYRTVASSGGVVMMTSRYEALGLVPLEAAACGAATIGPDVLGLRESIRTEWGFTFPADASDVDAAAMVADWIDANPASVSSFRARADAVAEQFSLSRMVDQYLSVYERATPLPAPRHATLPPTLPAGAQECIAASGGPGHRHRTLWQKFARDLVNSGDYKFALGAVRMALRHDPRAMVRPRDAVNLAGTTARAIRGLVRAAVGRRDHS